MLTVFCVVSVGTKYIATTSTTSTQFKTMSNIPSTASSVHQMNEKQEFRHSTEAPVSSSTLTTETNTRTDGEKGGAVTPIAAAVGGTVIFLLGLVLVVVFTSHR